MILRFLYILIGLYLALGVYANSEIESYPKDSIPVERIKLDPRLYDDFKSQKAYDYYQHAPDYELKWLNELRERFYRWLERNMSSSLTKKQSDGIMIIGVIVFLVLLVLFLYLYKPSLFYLDRKRKLEYQIDDEELENRNINALIQKALEQEQYTEALRWKYMKVLKVLNEKELISFDPYKTVNEYVYEITRKELKVDFRSLSGQFAYYRYGNGIASRDIFDTFDEASNHFLNRL